MADVRTVEFRDTLRKRTHTDEVEQPDAVSFPIRGGAVSDGLQAERNRMNHPAGMIVDACPVPPGKFIRHIVGATVHGPNRALEQLDDELATGGLYIICVVWCIYISC